MGVSAVSAEDIVPLRKCSTGTHSGRLLADAEMDGTAHLLLLVFPGDSLFDEADPEHAVI